MMPAFKNRTEQRTRPFCQTTGCFDLADVYVVLKESEEPNYYEFSKEKKYAKSENSFSEVPAEFDGFKMILYMCRRHDYEFRYLIKGSELVISKRCSLRKEHPCY